MSRHSLIWPLLTASLVLKESIEDDSYQATNPGIVGTTDFEVIDLALASLAAGRRFADFAAIAIRMLMITIATDNSIKVKARLLLILDSVYGYFVLLT